MSPCPECQSGEVYRYAKPIVSTSFGGEQIPKLGSNLFSAAKMLPVVCASCGYIRYFVDEQARAKLRQSEHWRPV